MFGKRLAFIALLLAICAGFALGLLIPRLQPAPAPRTYNTAIILQQVKSVSELVTVQYVLERIVSTEVPASGALRQMFSGENRVLLLAHGIVKAGINLADLRPADLKINGDTITVRLPPAQITDAYLDDKETKVIERTTGLFRSFDKDLEQNVRQDAVDDLRRAARTHGILKDAEVRARAQLGNLFRQLGFQRVAFEKPSS